MHNGFLEALYNNGLIGLFLGPAIMSILMTLWREGAEKVRTSGSL